MPNTVESRYKERTPYLNTVQDYKGLSYQAVNLELPPNFQRHQTNLKKFENMAKEPRSPDFCPLTVEVDLHFSEKSYLDLVTVSCVDKNSILIPVSEDNDTYRTGCRALARSYQLLNCNGISAAWRLFSAGSLYIRAARGGKRTPCIHPTFGAYGVSLNIYGLEVPQEFREVSCLINFRKERALIEWEASNIAGRFGTKMTDINFDENGLLRYVTIQGDQVQGRQTDFSLGVMKDGEYRACSEIQVTDNPWVACAAIGAVAVSNNLLLDALETK